MKIGIVGAGGVGGFLAATLAKSGEAVYLIARGKHRAAIEKEGLTLEGRQGRLRAKPAGVDDKADGFGIEADAVLFATKGYDLEEAAEAARGMIGPKTLLVPLGNGVDNARTLHALYPHNPVANGAIYIVSHLHEPGHIRLMGQGAKIVVGMSEGHSDRLVPLVDALRRSGAKTILSDDITTDVWRKYLLIAAMGTLTSCYDAPMGAIVAHHGEALRQALEEIVAVGQKVGAKLTKEDIEDVITQLGRVPFDAPTSMWLDFKKGAKTELEQLTGYVVKQADRFGIEVPVMRMCYEKLGGSSEGEASPV